MRAAEPWKKRGWNCVALTPHQCRTWRLGPPPRSRRGGNRNMPPYQQLFLVGNIQQAISNLLTTMEPTFIRGALNIWLAVSVILLIVTAARAWFTTRSFEALLFAVGQ